MIEPLKTRPQKKRRRVRSKPEVRDLQARKTALVVAVVLFLSAMWNFYRGRMMWVAAFASIAGVLVLIGLFVPVAARGFHRFWMGVAGVLGYINSRILLSLLYYGMFMPYSLVGRLVGRDPLRRRGLKESSYWVQRKHTRQANEQFERLF